MRKHILLVSCAASAFTLTGAMFAPGAVMAQSAPTARVAAAAAPSSEPTTIGEIVVTAEKREANLQDVPEAVTAFTAQDRNIKGINTVQDMTNFTPGLTYSSQLDRPAMRGLARSTNIYLADSSVAVYYDDFFSNSTFLVGRDDMLIDQVEVLLGPQGTLYGRNSIGGLINTISKRPTDEFTGEVRAEAGNYGYTKFEGTIAGPLAPNLTFRLSAYDENQSRGWLNNLVPGTPGEGGVRHDPYGDFQLQYKTDHDELWFDSYVVGFNHDRGGPGSLLGTPTAGNYGTALTTYGQLTFNPNFPYGGGAVPGSVVGQIGNNNPVVTTGSLRNFAHAVPTDITLNKAYTFTFHWLHHFDGFDVKYVGGYSQYHYELHTSYFNNDNSPITSYQIPITPLGATTPPANELCSLGQLGLGPLAGTHCGPLTVNPAQEFSFTTQTDWFSHEITFSSTTNSRFQWITGLYYYHETDNNPEDFQELQQPQIGHPIELGPLATAGAFVPAIANPSQNYLLLDYQDQIESTAAYAQVDYKILPTLKLTGGLRYTFDWKHGQEETRYIDFSSGVLNPASFGSDTPAVDISPLEMSFAPGKGVCSLPTLNTTGQFAGDYSRCLSDHSEALTGTAGIEWTPDSETLVYARYNRGYKAFAFNAGYVGANPEALPEHVDDYEAGFKKTFGSTFVLDADAFYYNYTNDQVPIGVPAGSVTLTEFINIPKAVSEGVEFTAYWRPVRHLDLSLTYGLDHTSIRSNCVSTGGTPVGACYVDALDPYATAPGARPVGAAAGGVFSQAVNGDELPNAPENKVAFNANYTFEFEKGNLILSGTYIWKDKSYGSIFTRTYDEAPSWSQVDLRVMWQGNHDRYEVIGYVKNLFNTYGYDAAATGYIVGPGGGTSYADQYAVPSFDLTPPRLYGIEVHYKF